MKGMVTVAAVDSLPADIIAQAESYSGIRAGIARLEDVLFSPSYRTVQEGPGAETQLDDVDVVVWPPEARSVLVLGLKVFGRVRPATCFVKRRVP